MPANQIPMLSPDKGVIRSVPREGQPPASCFDALNCVPYDRYGRKRLSQRGGLVRQNTVPLNNSFTKIQGMIEAPLLSYAQAESAIGTLASLSMPTFGNVWNGSTNTKTGNGDSYSHTYPTASLTLEYDWQFQFNFSLTVPGNGYVATAPTGGPFDDLGNNLIYINWPMTASTPGYNNLILVIGYDFVMYPGLNGNYAIKTVLCVGDAILANVNNWYRLPAHPGTSYPSFTGVILQATPSFSSSITFDLSIQPPNEGGAVTLSAYIPPGVIQQVLVYPAFGTGSSPPPPFSTPYSYSEWPNLNVLDVLVAGDGNPGFDIHWTSTFSLTDTGTNISAVPLSPDFATPASFLVAACHGLVYKVDVAGNVTQATGTYSLKLKTLVDMAFLSGTSVVNENTLNPSVFMVDGTNFNYYDITTGIVAAMTEEFGTLPTNCSLIRNWRGRLVLAGDSSNPANVYMSRVGNPRDWNYAALDPSAAVALELSTAGQLGEPVMALIPFSDDYMLIGCLASLWMLQGDPADGGTVVNVSKSMGMTANNAWCVGPDGTLYFIARGGLYSVKPAWEFYRPPELLSGQTYDQYFQSIIAGNYYLSMQFDVDNHYIHIFATSIQETNTGTHMIYDVRNGGLWPQIYPHNYSPTCSTTYLANSTQDRPPILMGGFDGVIRYWSPQALDDDGTAISSYALLGPVKADPEAAILSGVTVDMGEVFYTNTATAAQNGLPTQTGINWNATATLFSGPDAFSVTEGAELGGVLSPYYNNPPVKSPHSFSAITMTLDRRQKTFRQRLRGGWHSLMISNSALDAYWSFESASFGFTASGKNRERR